MNHGKPLRVWERDRRDPLTHLATNDRRPHNQADELVQHVVGEGHEGLGAGKAQGGQAGSQLLLHGALAQDRLLEPEREGPFL